MKNLHLIPTDKLSKIGKFIDTNNLVLRNINDIPRGENVHIYITSDEEIKDVRPHKGKWQIEQGHILNKFPNYLTDLSECKLVIMTTDKDLIKDGAQEIDDEFLEWFVKNPSCEEVKVRKNPKVHFIVKGKGVKGFNQGYKIIIPKEEPKQIKCYCGHTTMCDCSPIEEPKQETLEEAAKRIYGTDESKDVEYYAFINGAKWQAERRYSEAIEFAEWIRIKDFQTASKDNWIGLDMKYYTTEELFEQFKKK